MFWLYIAIFAVTVILLILSFFVRSMALHIALMLLLIGCTLISLVPGIVSAACAVLAGRSLVLSIALAHEGGLF